MSTPVITRFAPSPTGHLHIGGVRTALFCWAYARGHEGRFLLRIEDTDQKRSSEDAARGILEDLAWLGIAWDDGPEFQVAYQVARLSEPDGTGIGTHRSESRATFGGDARGVGPFYQAQRLEVYQRFLSRMLDADLAYPAFETAEELGAMRAEAQGRKETFCYRRRPDYDRDRAHAEMRRREAAGEAFVVRFRMPAEPIRVADSVLGDIDFDEQHTDDFVLRKADGYPTYHFAVVIDDELMGVTHVLRGQEHLNNTPRHVALQRALTHEDGTPFRTPVYAHMPLIFNADGSKMSKRDKDKAVRRAALADDGSRAVARDLVGAEEFEAWQADKTRQLPPEKLSALALVFSLELPEIDVEDFRRSGYLPPVLCNYLALLGWNPGMKNADDTDLDRFDMAFLCEHFAIERIGKSNSKFDREKLAAFNQAAIATMAPDEFGEALRGWCDRYDADLQNKLADRFDLAAAAIQPRVKALGQCREPIAFALIADDAVVFEGQAVQKALHKGEPNGLGVLADFRDTLASVDPFDPETVETTVKTYCERKEIGMGKLAQPLRVAITGNTVSPGLGETLALVGKAGAMARIDRCLRECVEPSEPRA